jgi:hypothetical protein
MVQRYSGKNHERGIRKKIKKHEKLRRKKIKHHERLLRKTKKIHDGFRPYCIPYFPRN